MRQRVSKYMLFLLLVGVLASVLVAGCAILPDGWLKLDTPAAAQPATRTVQLALDDGSHAVLQLTDRELMNEFAERQPLSIPLRRLPNRSIVEDAPPWVTRRSDGAAVTPAAGDLVINTAAGEVALYCQDGPALSQGIIVGHVTSGLGAITKRTGMFQVFVTK